MKAYIQTNLNGDWVNENCFSSSVGFHQMGYDIVKFNLIDTTNDESFDIKFKDFNKLEDVCHGGINGIRNLFDRFNVPQPEIHNPHEYLLEFTGRTFSEGRLGDIIKTFSTTKTSELTPIFIKPLNDHKLFTGLVVKSFVDLIKLGRLKKDTMVLQSNVVKYISEYRVFINRQGIMGCKNYTGEYNVLPNFKIVEQAIEAYGKNTQETPLSYSLDFGITDNGETQLIEINDGFSLGSYGLNSFFYAKMIRDRWHQIMNIKRL